MTHTTVISSKYDVTNQYTLYTKKVGPGILCIWQINNIQRISYIFSTEYQVHKKVRAHAKKMKNKTVGSNIQNLKTK